MSAVADLLSSFDVPAPVSWFDVADSITELMESVKELIQVTRNRLVNGIDGQADSERRAILATCHRSLERRLSTIWLEWEQLPVEMRPHRTPDQLAVSPIDRPFHYSTYCEAMIAAAHQLSGECGLFLRSSKGMIDQKAKDQFVLWIFYIHPPSELSDVHMSRDHYFERLFAHLHNELREHAVSFLARFPDAPRSRVVYDADEGRLYRETSHTVGLIELDGRNPRELDDSDALKHQIEHSEDFTCVTVNGAIYNFTPPQSKVFRCLYEHWKKGVPDVTSKRLLKEAQSDSIRLRDVFRSTHRAGDAPVLLDTLF